MKLLFLLLVIPVFTTAVGQETNQPKVQSKFSLGFNFSPDYCFRTLKDKGTGSSGGLVVKERNDAEIAKFGYTTGLIIRYSPSPKFAIESGIQYSNKGYTTRTQDLVFSSPDPAYPLKEKTTFFYHYIGVPVMARLTVGKSRVRFTSSLGIAVNFLLQVTQSAVLEYAGGRTEKSEQPITEGFQKFDISPMMGAGIDYQLNGKVHLAAEPSFRYGILTTREAPVTEHLWNAGLNLCVYYELK